ncbi:hypothetical protein ACJX0J_015802, partial [Zea mays]
GKIFSKMGKIWHALEIDIFVYEKASNTDNRVNHIDFKQASEHSRDLPDKHGEKINGVMDIGENNTRDLSASQVHNKIA